MATPKFAGQRFVRETDRFRLGRKASQSNSSAKMLTEHASLINGSFLKRESVIIVKDKKTRRGSRFNPRLRVVGRADGYFASSFSLAL
jgi:hypothetical protein